MKKAIVLFLILLLCLGCSAWAESSVNVEVIKMDGVSVVVLTPPETMLRARGLAANAKGAEDKRAEFVLPQFLTLIEESAFEGIAAECIEVSENVVSIEARAFADCQNLREIHIPASVVEIHKDALEGCKDVTVYGSTDVAKTFAEANGFTFIDPNAETPGQPVVIEKPPVVLPFIPADG